MGKTGGRVVDGMERSIGTDLCPLPCNRDTAKVTRRSKSEALALEL